MKINIVTIDSGLKSSSSKVISEKVLKKELNIIKKHFLSLLRSATHLKRNKISDVTLNLHLCGKAKIKRLNREYRGKDKVTDVLSFPIFENLRLDYKNNDFLVANIVLGDVVVCREKCVTQAKEFNVTVKEEFIHLFVHGFLHLLGYDHEISRKEEMLMEKLEEKLILKILRDLKKGK